MLVVLATVSMLLTCNSGYSPGEMKMSIKKINGKWIALSKVNQKHFCGIGRTCAGALSALRNNIAEYVCHDIH